MSFPSETSVGGNHESSEPPRHGLVLQEQAYNSASDALEAYIAEFEKRTQFYTRRPSDLLAPKPKYYFMDALERSLRGNPSKSPAQKAEELVEWVNQTYNRDLTTKVEPFGYKATPELPGSMSENDVSPNRHHYSSGDTRPKMHLSPSSSSQYYSREEDDLSSLPSASSSVVDLDSNAETVETDVLLSSYKGESSEYLRHSSGYASRSKAGPSTAHKPRGSPSSRDTPSEYPSWVSSIGKEYPTWVEDLDNTSVSRMSEQRPKHRHSNHSPSSSNARHTSSGSSSRLKVSDLRPKNLPPKSRSSPKPKWNKAVQDWPDNASVDTDMLISQPVYGAKPVNMGGDLHKTLYDDKSVTRLIKESTKKLKKSSGRSRSRSKQEIPVSPRSKSLMTTPQRGDNTVSPKGYQSVPPRPRPEASISPGTYRDYSPLRSEHLRAASSGGRLETRAEQYIKEVPQFSSTERQYRDSSPAYVSPSTLVRQRATAQNYTDEEFSPNYEKRGRAKTEQSHARDVTRERSRHVSHANQRGGTLDRHSPSHVKHYVPRSKRSKDLRIKITEPSDGDSTDTDREMRKSPTGIKMEKMYREQSTMHPWKSMMQSPSQYEKSVSVNDLIGYGKPVYESTPVVRESIKSKGPKVDPYGTPYQNGVTRSDVYVTERLRHVERPRSRGKLKSPPRPEFTSTRKQDAVFHKPPSGTRGSEKRGHRRSRTMPDLRKIATTSKSQPHLRGSRRSYDDDMLSVMTSDTELLVNQPSMPIVDVSPSLTTVSDSSDTIVGSDTETEKEDYTRTARTQSKRVTIGKSTESRTQVEDDKLVPTTVFASSSPYAAVREELPKRYHLWKLDDDTTAPDSFIRKKHQAGDKTTIISSFLEDCLNIDENHNITKPKPSGAPYPTLDAHPDMATRLSGREGAPGPVEALKNMLFTMQDMAHHKDETPRPTKRPHRVYRKPRIPEPRDVDFDSASDDQSDVSAEMFRGHESLQRAYHHLEKLKQLVGSEDDRSTASSEL